MITQQEVYKKARKLASGLPLIRHVLALWFAFVDPKTPLPVKATIMLAVTYFVVPFDLIPDMVAGLGYSDDAAVIYGALKAIGGMVTVEHYEKAELKLSEWKTALPA